MSNIFTYKTESRVSELRAIDEGIFRVRVSETGKFRESLLSRYNILEEKPKDIKASFDGGVLSTERFTLTLSGDTLCVKGEGHELTFSLSPGEEGFHIALPLTENERLYGLGDENRDGIMKRGRVARLWQTDYVGYGPIPFLMSSSGWGLLVNCTFEHTYDMGVANKDLLSIDAQKGGLDLYIFLASDMKGVLNLYTDVSGKPIMLPKSAYGFTFVCNEQITARETVEDCASFRRYGIPCDIIGLEPGWMEKHYDFSTEKKWDQGRFHFPSWEPKNYSGIFSFCYNLRKLGFKLSLWLCCDYDLLYAEEGEVRRRVENSMDGRFIKDEHLHYSVNMDHITKIDEPWFEHLKKFVDNGAAAFKLDGSNQCLEHPDRLWCGKYLDDEVHNVYCVIYAKQMKEGFANYTGKRALIYTPCLYAGTQKYAASWAGDTGGGEGTLTSVLNLALSGHANASCDLDPTDPYSIHYGFLMPWSQLLGWRNLHQPWLLGEELEEMVRYYSRLRSSLFPYIYSMAHITNRTALPLARPLCLAYPNSPEFDSLRNEYMFGDSLLVTAFNMHVTLPEGKWTDFFTGEVHEGSTEFDYVPPKGRGGALFVKEGSILVMQEPMPHLDKAFPEEYFIHVYPGADASFDLIEDDGITYDYEAGKFFSTKMTLTDSSETGFTFTLAPRTGEWGEKKTDVLFDVNTMSENHLANIPEAPELSHFTVVIHGEYTVDGVAATFENGCTTFRITKEEHAKGALSFRAVKK